MTFVELLMQVSGAVAAPLAAWAIKEIRDWKTTTDAQVERNAEAMWGSDDPYAEWPGTVSLTIDNRDRIERIERLVTDDESFES